MISIKKLLKQKNYIRVPLQKMKTNHLELFAKINGVKGRFILDTGASNSCVGVHLADFFKLQIEISDTKAAGAGAINMETHLSDNNLLEIDSWKTQKESLVLFDLQHVNSALEQHNEKPIHGIIGADILEKGKALIDYNKKTLYLKKIKKKVFLDK